MTIDPFLSWRRTQEQRHAETANTADPMASLISVELNIMDACNRTCVFCPHGDPATYPNELTKRMSKDIARIIGGNLAAIGYRGRISLSGYGEPMLHAGIYDIIAELRACLPDNTIEMNTNGDVLSAERLEQLDAAGLTYCYVNLYDGPHQREGFEAMFDTADLDSMECRLRDHWDPEDDWGLILNNRSGLVGEVHAARPRGGVCNYPAYKLFLDWNGDALFCANDWGRQIVIGNVTERSIPELWLSDEMREVRKRLFFGDRSQSPCATCSVHGTMHGEFSRKLLAQHYGWDT